MKIYDVRHGNGADKNRYCGPSALSAVTGMTTGEAARLLRFVSKRRSIKGASTHSMARALALCGIRTVGQKVRVEHYKNKRGDLKARGLDSLAAWLSNTVSLRQTGRVFLIAAGNHWQIISGRRYVCGLTGEIVSITDKKVKRRAKVTEVYELTGSKIVIPKEAKPSPTDSAIRRYNDRSKAAFRTFTRKHKLDYRFYTECGLRYIEVQPTPFWPDGLDTRHYDYDTTLGRLQTCLDNPSLVEHGSYSE